MRRALSRDDADYTRVRVGEHVVERRRQRVHLVQVFAFDPELEFARRIPAVLADLEHGDDDHLDLHRGLRPRAGAAYTGEGQRDQQGE